MRAGGVLAAAILAVTLRAVAPPAAAGRPDCVPDSTPAGAAIPPDVQPGCSDPIAAFNDHSWRLFLFLTRRADPARRGMPRDGGQSNSDPLVFETYKAHWEVFQDGRTPLPWARWPAAGPCRGVTLAPGDMVLGSFSEIEDVRQVRAPGLVDGPLVAQNGTYIRYGIGYNPIAFQALIARRLYLASMLGSASSPVRFPPGSIAVKSAWMILPGGNIDRRYYTRVAWVRDAADERCSRQRVALIGLHIIHKTPHNPQWIWSTFEHRDNLPPGIDGRGPFALSDGNPLHPMPLINPYAGKPLPAAPRSFNVQRLVPIHPSTRQTNERYRARLASAASVWQHYELTMTQWPREPDQPQFDGSPGNSIPGNNTDNTAYANPAFETFFQAPVQRNGCMSCHTRARDTSDFLWTPVMHAWRGAGGPAAARRRLLIEGLAERLALPAGGDKKR